MAKLTDWVSGELKNWLWGLVRSALEWFDKQSSPLMKVVAALWVFAVAWVALMVWASAEVVASITDFCATGLPTLSGTLLPYFQFLNRFIPLEESLATMLVLFHLWLVVVLVRWIKSFVWIGC